MLFRFLNTDPREMLSTKIKGANLIRAVLQAPPIILHGRTQISQCDILHDPSIKSAFFPLYLGQRSHRCD